MRIITSCMPHRMGPVLILPMKRNMNVDIHVPVDLSTSDCVTDLEVSEHAYMCMDSCD